MRDEFRRNNEPTDLSSTYLCSNPKPQGNNPKGIRRARRMGEGMRDAGILETGEMVDIPA